MKIGVIGAGFVGQSFAKALVAVGHEVMLSSRDPHSERMQSLKLDFIHLVDEVKWTS